MLRVLLSALLALLVFVAGTPRKSGAQAAADTAKSAYSIELTFDMLIAADRGLHSRVLSVVRERSDGGLFFSATEFPFSGILLRDQRCSGTLIAPDVFLTAAHCVCETVEGTPPWFSDAASCTAANAPASRATYVFFPAAGLFETAGPPSINPGYRRPDFTDKKMMSGIADLALVRLKNPVPIQPVGLPGQESDQGRLVMLGFGRTYVIPGVDKNVVPPDRYDLLSTFAFTGEPDSSACPPQWKDVICIRFNRRQFSGKSQQLPCSGDSGGGLVGLDPNGQPRLLGVVSSADENTECEAGSGTAIFTSTLPHSQWIDAFVQNSGKSPRIAETKCATGFVPLPEGGMTEVSVASDRKRSVSLLATTPLILEQVKPANQCEVVRDDKYLMSCHVDGTTALSIPATGPGALEIVLCD